MFFVGGLVFEVIVDLFVMCEDELVDDVWGEWFFD